MSATIPPERHNPKAWANYGCKDTKKKRTEQGKRVKTMFFTLLGSVLGVECGAERSLA